MTRITSEAFGRLFDAFSATADRIELRDYYRSDLEDEVVRRFVAGEPDDMAWSKPWLDMIRARTEEGKLFRRVRVVTVPLSEYQRCGVMRVAPHNIEAGEDIRYLDRAQATDLDLPVFDYWLFDVGTSAARAAKLLFDDRGSFLGAEIITGDPLGDLSAAFGRAFSHALLPEHFAEVHRLG
ncbi:hypothetical protein J4573_15075 [Actinomadura barringtoniae]|uniref:DUF6879 domain-containing protein n=1 Tax=Actinomadura barringtoniae TaxID=1427535 RepID=A0A939P9Q8_9ACTN|nr:DUF6879 family protein [Actinomadura barringtoniae]MBO2448423.1 hypothetical protein [Actinomadura barringtoniae]